MIYATNKIEEALPPTSTPIFEFFPQTLQLLLTRCSCQFWVLWHSFLLLLFNFYWVKSLLLNYILMCY